MIAHVVHSVPAGPSVWQGLSELSAEVAEDLPLNLDTLTALTDGEMVVLLRRGGSAQEAADLIRTIETDLALHYKVVDTFPKEGDEPAWYELAHAQADIIYLSRLQLLATRLIPSLNPESAPTDDEVAMLARGLDAFSDRACMTQAYLDYRAALSGHDDDPHAVTVDDVSRARTAFDQSLFVLERNTALRLQGQSAQALVRLGREQGSRPAREFQRGAREVMRFLLLDLIARQYAEPDEDGVVRPAEDAPARAEVLARLAAENDLSAVRDRALTAATLALSIDDSVEQATQAIAAAEHDARVARHADRDTAEAVAEDPARHNHPELRLLAEAPGQLYVYQAFRHGLACLGRDHEWMRIQVVDLVVRQDGSVSRPSAESLAPVWAAWQSANAALRGLEAAAAKVHVTCMGHQHPLLHPVVDLLTEMKLVTDDPACLREVDDEIVHLQSFTALRTQGRELSDEDREEAVRAWTDDHGLWATATLFERPATVN